MGNWLLDGLMPNRKLGRSEYFISQPEQSRITYIDFEKLTAKFANGLLTQNVKVDDRVVVQAEKSIEVIALYLATIRVGAIFIPLNTAYVATEVNYFIDNAEPILLICEPNKEEEYRQLDSAKVLKILTLDAKSQGSWLDNCRGCSEKFQNVARGKDDIAAILYTSGTTGRSKGAMLSHDNLLSNAYSLVKLWQFTSDDVLLHALPIYHTHGLFVAINIALVAGCTLNFLQRFEASEVCDKLVGSTVMMGVPTFYTRLLEHPEFSSKQCQSMRLFISGSAPLLAKDHQRFKKLTGHTILERYGMTETNMMTSNPYFGERRAGTVGHAIENIDVRIVSETNDGTLIHHNVLQPDENSHKVGMIQVRGPSLFKGYWKMPEKTAEEFTNDGYFITGDLAQYDRDGYISIVGRDKDMIISGGLNVYPIDVENVINACSSVKESAVFGVTDADFGEVVMAIVISSNQRVGSHESETAKSEILDAIKENLAAYKRPKKILFLDQLPRNAMGKVQKKVLRELYSS